MVKSTLPDASSIERINILGVPVSALNMTLAIRTIEGWVKRREARYVCVCDVYSASLASGRTDHLAALQGADMVAPDGKPLSVVGRLRGNKTIQRVSGPDLMPALCAYSASRGWKHYFYGGAEGVAEELAANLKAANPELEIAGTECPPFREQTRDEKQATVDRITASGAHIVWVGLGCPKQERWIAENVGKIPNAVLIGVGAAFDFQTGRVRRAPMWMRNAGLEWLHRLISEPRRLWRRYLVYAPRFVFLNLIEAIGLVSARTIPDPAIGMADPEGFGQA